MAKTIVYSIKTCVNTKIHTETGMPSVNRVFPPQWQFSAIRIHFIMESHDCLKVGISVLVGAFHIIMGSFRIMMGSFNKIMGSLRKIMGLFHIIMGSFRVIMGSFRRIMDAF